MAPRLRLPSLNLGDLLPWLVLLGGTGRLSWRYQTSAAFEHPTYFSLSSLLWCATFSIGFAVWSTWRRKGLKALLALLLRLPPWQLVALVPLVVTRTILFNLSTEFVQCSMQGITALTPLLLAMFDAILPEQAASYETLSTADDERTGLPEPTPSSPSYEKRDTRDRAGSGSGSKKTRGPSRSSFALYIVIALIWGLTARNTLRLMDRSTGAICPSLEKLDFYVPAGQVAMIACDAFIMLSVFRMRSRSNDAHSDSVSSWVYVAELSQFSSWALMLRLFWIQNFAPELARRFTWADSVRDVVVHDLLYDSATAAAMLLSAITLFASTHPATIAAITSGASLYFYYLRNLRDERGLVYTGRGTGLASRIGVYVAILCLFFLMVSDNRLPGSAKLRVLSFTRRRWLSLCYVGFLVALLANRYIYAKEPAVGLRKIIQDAHRESDVWIRSAHESSSAQEAAAAYRLRYGIPPPPKFDKWYEFAVEQNSSVFDTFDQINDDLLPFWAVEPALLRDRTTHLLEQTKLGIGGFRIKNGTVELSPHTPGTHFWMMTGFEKMLEPFLQHLPDMDLAFNLDDECRVSVPFAQADKATGRALEARKRAPLSNGLKNFSSKLEPPWSDSYWADDWAQIHAGELSPAFSFRTENDIFDEYVVATCPPTSPASTTRWWSRRTALPAGRGVVSNPADAVDLCSRFDIPRMHGFLRDPGAFAITQVYFPIFSQSRISGFSDILVPSPWNFMSKVDHEEAADMPWADKASSVFWRGGSTDGLSKRGGWTTFLRARFVHLAQLASQRQRYLLSGSAAAAVKSVVDSSLAMLPDTHGLLHQHHRPNGFNAPTINVSFVGNFTKCWLPDCMSQTQSFYGAPEVARPPEGFDFQAHWLHRHLVDLDGAGFSGRFLPFLKSRSLVYRASLFRTWYDERVHPWRHFVPLDVSLVDLWGLVARMERKLGFGKKDKSRSKGVTEKEGEAISIGETIATDGRDWALKALRKEDMQVYMFRLLLEWARLIDDKREELGFE